MKRLLCALFCLLPVTGFTQQDPSAQARAAIEMLDEAVGQLESAQSARDRIRALTETVSALEEGLAALRGGVRQASLRQAEISQNLRAQDDEIAALLAVLMRMGDTTAPTMMLHPGGPKSAVRAGLMLSELAPALNAQATTLRDDIEELAVLQTLQSDAEGKLNEGLLSVQTARAALNQAIAERTDLPKRFVNDPVREAILIASAETLSQFAAGLDRVSVDVVAPPPAELEGAKGELRLPVRGTVLHASGEADAAGVTRPGLVLDVASGALVTTPVPATIRYAGPLLNLGQVVILEPQRDVLFVFAGLETIYGAAGDVLDGGSPVGLMGENDHKNAADLSTDGDDTGTTGPETLYIEVRQNNTPEDPSLWFRTDKDG